MTKKSKYLVILLVILLLAVAFIVGDYAGLFGLKKYSVQGFIESSFKTEDSNTGAPVAGIRVKCFQKGNDNACTQKHSSSRAVVMVRIPIRKIVWQSLLFRKKEQLVKTNDEQIHIMFIHHDYDNPVKSFVIAELYKKPVIKYPVKMERRFQ